MPFLNETSKTIADPALYLVGCFVALITASRLAPLSVLLRPCKEAYSCEDTLTDTFFAPLRERHLATYSTAVDPEKLAIHTVS